MGRIKSRNTKPAKLLRSLLHAWGYRFRLHRADLPGKPDIVLPKYKAVIFVHGCFWHQHLGCREGRMPGSNLEYWTQKLVCNVARGADNLELLAQMGWIPLVVWECELKNVHALREKVEGFLKECALGHK